MLCAFVLSACEPGVSPYGFGDVRDDIEGEYYAELLDSEYTCPWDLYLPVPADWMWVHIYRYCTDSGSDCTPEEVEGGFDITFILRQDSSVTWYFNSSLLVSRSGEFSTVYTLHFLDGPTAEVALSGSVRHGELDASYTVDIASAACVMAATVHGARRVRVDEGS
ncbi:MAG: hypothetical protein AAB562_02925 [Patescibacteria group bacterium]